MSGFFGILNRNGELIDKKIVDTMQNAMSYWKPDEENICVDGTIAMGHTMLWNTPESKYEQLPLCNDTTILTMDARIDNREELSKVLELPDLPINQIGDSEFILGAYKKWGEECPKHLLGDFAFAIWDEEKQQLFCARDHIGIKQLYYYVNNDLFVFGNDLKGLFGHSSITKKINDEAVANYFVNYQLNSRVLTFFEDIVKLPPAHKITITNSKIDIKCYWNLEDRVKMKLPTLEAYVKKLRELLEQAVYARIRSDFPITSHLSGGLDSSSIAVIAARKLHKQDKRLLAFNWMHKPDNNDNPLNFEWYNSETIAKIENIEHNYVTMSADDIYQYICERDIAYGETVDLWYEYPLRKSVQMRNSRIILSGWGGDEFATYKGRSYYSDLVWQGKFSYALRELRYFAKEKNINSIKSILGLLYYKIFMPCVPRNLYCYMPRNTCEKVKKSYPMIKKDFLILVNNTLKKVLFMTRQPGKTIREDMLAYWSSGHVLTRIESWETESINNRLTYVYPMLDKRIIEFMLEVPAEYLVQNREGRYLFRLAMEDLLPDEILWMGKEQEINRVNRLLSLLVSTYKILLKKKDIESVQSKYINVPIFLKLLQNMDEDILSAKYTEINGLVSIFMSKILHSQHKDV